MADRIYLEEHPLARAIDPKQALWPALLLLLSTIISLWSWMPGNKAFLAASPQLVYGQHEYWRLLTSIFLHADIVHLLANTGLFFVFGTLLRNYFGAFTFPWLSLVGALATEAIALLGYDADVRLIGASGMVYFMAGVWIMLFFRYGDYLSILHRIMRAVAFILVVLLPTQIESNVSYSSHAIGFGLGLFLGWLALPWVKPLPLSAEEQARGKRRADARRALLRDEEDEAGDADEVEIVYELGRYRVRRLRPWMREVSWDDEQTKPEIRRPDA